MQGHSSTFYPCTHTNPLITHYVLASPLQKEECKVNGVVYEVLWNGVHDERT